MDALKFVETVCRLQLDFKVGNPIPGAPAAAGGFKFPSLANEREVNFPKRLECPYVLLYVLV